MEELYNTNLKWKKVAGDGATSPNQVHDPNIVKTKGNLGKVATNFQKGRRWNVRGALSNDQSDIYIDYGEFGNIAGFQQYGQTMTTPWEGGDPNKYPNEKDMQPFYYSLKE
ncbi:hypothetical protein CK203_116367 [Vitis vinifera]|uniref:Uncharacterized protein n=1 Tax=Vitis vinifera TaxID=29760 RepID=A0A438D6Q5_VITVI|nr:hypothetical protein CK203_116367 [Vitis vinifera]